MKAYAVNLGGNYSATNSVSFVSSNSFELQLSFATGQPLGRKWIELCRPSFHRTGGPHPGFDESRGLAALTNFIGTNASVNFRDAAATNYNDRFYRAVIP